MPKILMEFLCINDLFRLADKPEITNVTTEQVLATLSTETLTLIHFTAKTYENICFFACFVSVALLHHLVCEVVN
jgi:hypothetical protein